MHAICALVTFAIQSSIELIIVCLSGKYESIVLINPFIVFRLLIRSVILSKYWFAI